MVKVLNVGSAKTKSMGKRRPRIRLTGFWLNELGFEYGKFVSLNHENGVITLKLENSENRNMADLLEVCQTFTNKKYTPHLEIKGFWLKNLGFDIGCPIVVHVQPEVIRIKLLDIEKLMD